MLKLNKAMQVLESLPKSLYPSSGNVSLNKMLNWNISWKLTLNFDSGTVKLLNIFLKLCLMFCFSFKHFSFQISALEMDIIEIDPDTKEMLKSLVSLLFYLIGLVYFCLAVFFFFVNKIILHMMIFLQNSNPIQLFVLFLLNLCGL